MLQPKKCQKKREQRIRGFSELVKALDHESEGLRRPKEWVLGQKKCKYEPQLGRYGSFGLRDGKMDERN